MDEHRIDAIARGLARARSRRGVLKGLAAGAIGALGLGLSRLDHAEGTAGSPTHGSATPVPPGNSACRSDGHPCEGNQACCDELVCVAPGPGAAKRCAPCPAGTVFLDGACCTPAAACPNGQTCGTAPDGCGGEISCGTCVAPQTCGGGGVPDACGCIPDPIYCGVEHCGVVIDSCGESVNCGPCCFELRQPCGGDRPCCDAGIACSPLAGICCNGVGGACASINDCCPGTACVGGACQVCVPENGACGSSDECCLGLGCVDGACHVLPPCSQFWRQCGDICVRLDDPQNCGACGVACADGMPCVNNECVPATPIA